MVVYHKTPFFWVLLLQHAFLIIYSADNVFSTQIDHKKFAQAVRQGDCFLVNRALQTGCIDVENHVDLAQGSYPPLMVATYNFDVPMIELLLSFGAQANVKDSHESTPLHQLASATYIHRDKIPLILSYIRFFIASGVDKNAPNKLGETPLMEAAQWKDSDLCLEPLMIRDQKQKQKALYQALLFHNPENIAVLLFHDTRINDRHIRLLLRERAKPMPVANTSQVLGECADLIVHGTGSEYFVTYWLRRFQKHYKSRQSAFTLLKNRERGRKR